MPVMHAERPNQVRKAIFNYGLLLGTEARKYNISPIVKFHHESYVEAEMEEPASGGLGEIHSD
jgi:hypothetical protein